MRRGIFPCLPFLFLIIISPCHSSPDPRSVGEVPTIPLPSDANSPITLPPSTSAVTCKCQPETQDRSDSPEIQIHIDVPLQPQASQNEQVERENDFKAFRSPFLGPDVSLHPPDFLLLGQNIGPFEGPRRRKRSLGRTPQKNVVVYRVNYHKTETLPPTTSSIDPTNLEIIKPEISKRNGGDDDQMAEEEKSEKAFAETLKEAWETYAPKSAPQPPKPQPNPEFLSSSNTRPLIARPIYFPLRLPIPSASYQFQRKGDLLSSPWDNRIIIDRSDAALPPPAQDIEPSIFSPLLENYIDFEVNHHEYADFMRKILFGFFVGLLIAGWIALGVAVGVFPLHLLLLKKGENSKRSAEDEDNDLQEVTDRVILALEGNWLQELEERVKSRNSNEFVMANCCLIPEKRTVNCKLLTKEERKRGNVKAPCGSNLVYNFQFGDDYEI